MESNNIVNFQDFTTILNAHTKKVWNLIEGNSYIVRSFPKQCASITIINRLIGLVSRLLANGPGDLGSIPGRGMPKT